MKTLLVGLGNPILGDDGVGWHIVDEFGRTSARVDLDIECQAVGGIGLMERLVGYDRAILVDSMNTGLVPQGSILCFDLDEMPEASSGRLASAHDASLKTALQVGRLLGIHLPDQIAIVGVESREVYNFSETLSPRVSAAVPQAIRKISELIDRSGQGGKKNDLA